MPVADIEQVGALALDPSGLRKSLTLGAVAISARCVLNRHRSAVVAARLESAERGGAAAHQRVHDTLLLHREPMRLAIGAGALTRRMSASSSAGRVAGAGCTTWATAQARAVRGNSSRSNGDGVAEVLSWARCR